MKKRLFCLAISALLLLSGCGRTAEGSTSPPSDDAPSAESEQPYDGPVNPLTGLPIREAAVNNRPVAIMLNNLKQALPQVGQSQADMIYEVLAEGGITRMLAVYQDASQAGMIGSVRSARTYYLELALGHDAIFLHAGGSPDAYAKIKSWGVTSLDGISGTYGGLTPESSLFWRDADRRKQNGYEHSMVTTGAAIEATLSNSSLRLEHADGYQYDMLFSPDGTPAHGTDATVITVPFSPYKTGVFTYDSESGLYMVEEYGAPYVDGNTGGQIGVTNVLILKTSCQLISGDSAGRIAVDLSSGGTGYYACGGQLIDVVWKKQSPGGQFIYTDLQGDRISFGAGKTYVNIVPLTCQVTVNELSAQLRVPSRKNS